MSKSQPEQLIEGGRQPSNEIREEIKKLDSHSEAKGSSENNSKRGSRKKQRQPKQLRNSRGAISQNEEESKDNLIR